MAAPMSDFLVQIKFSRKVAGYHPRARWKAQTANARAEMPVNRTGPVRGRGLVRFLHCVATVHGLIPQPEVKL